MNPFSYKDTQFFVEDIPVTELAKEYGTPCYVYSKQAFLEHRRRFELAFQGIKHRICYAVKANSNIAVLNLLAKENSGFDIVSLGELERVLAAGGNPSSILFSGVGKSSAEVERALSVGIGQFNVESLPELYRINDIAGALGKIASIAFRINPDVDAQSHPYITTGLTSSKFGIPVSQAIEYYQLAAKLPHIAVKGIAFHIGSQLLNLLPIDAALAIIMPIIDDLKEQGIGIEYLDIGGGLGVRYYEETPPHLEDYAEIITRHIGDRPLKVLLEPGRAIAANAGILVTKVEFIKETDDHRFAIVDAGMNDLVRPSLYQAYHDIVPAIKTPLTEIKPYDIVGPVCESGDFLGKNRHLNLKEGDLLAILSAGAYGYVMGSNYNSRPRPAEVLVDGNRSYLIRRRETIKELFALEKIPEL